jgi:hypothetical protein
MASLGHKQSWARVRIGQGLDENGKVLAAAAVADGVRRSAVACRNKIN